MKNDRHHLSVSVVLPETNPRSQTGSAWHTCKCCYCYNTAGLLYPRNSHLPLTRTLIMLAARICEGGIFWETGNLVIWRWRMLLIINNRWGNLQWFGYLNIGKTVHGLGLSGFNDGSMTTWRKLVITRCHGEACVTRQEGCTYHGARDSDGDEQHDKVVYSSSLLLSGITSVRKTKRTNKRKERQHWRIGIH